MTSLWFLIVGVVSFGFGASVQLAYSNANLGVGLHKLLTKTHSKMSPSAQEEFIKALGEAVEEM